MGSVQNSVEVYVNHKTHLKKTGGNDNWNVVVTTKTKSDCE